MYEGSGSGGVAGHGGVGWSRALARASHLALIDCHDRCVIPSASALIHNAFEYGGEAALSGLRANSTIARSSASLKGRPRPPVFLAPLMMKIVQLTDG